MATKTKTPPTAAEVVDEALAERQRRLELVAQADMEVLAAIAERDRRSAAVDAGLAETAAEINARADALHAEVLEAERTAAVAALAGDMVTAQRLWGEMQSLMERHKATVNGELLTALHRLPGYERAMLQRRWPSGLQRDPRVPAPGCHPTTFDHWHAALLASDQKRREQDARRAAFAARQAAKAEG